MKIQSKTINLLVTAAAIATTLYTGSASAASFTNQWSYKLNDGWFDVAPPSVVGTDPNPVLGLPTVLTWGTPVSGQSSIAIVGPDGPGQASGNQLFTNGPLVNTVQFLHSNFVIVNDNTHLKSATLQSQIDLQGFNPANPLNLVGSLFFNLTFNETTNAVPCVVSSPVPCNDIFAIAVPGATFDVVNGILSVISPFSYDGFNYQSIIQIDGLQKLGAAACADTGAGPDCVGFTTVENQQNTLQIAVGIRSVPEPNILLVFGIGLASLGFMGSRRNQA